MAVPVIAETDLVIRPRFGWRSLLTGVAAGLAFGCWMALADATMFAGAVPEVQREILNAGGLMSRLALFMRGSLIDELVLRLIGQSALIWAIIIVSGRRGAAAAWPAILLVAFVLWPLWASGYIRELDWTTLTLAREVALHGAAGVLWGWLCWRHGWLTGLAGHESAHLSLQLLLPLTV